MAKPNNFMTWNQYMLSTGPMVFEIPQTVPQWQYKTQTGTDILPNCPLSYYFIET